MTRAQVAALPHWERRMLFEGALAHHGIELKPEHHLAANDDAKWNLPPPPSASS